MSYLSEELLEAAVAVGLVVLLFERALVQLLQAERTYEVLGMEFAEHRRYATTWKERRICQYRGEYSPQSKASKEYYSHQ